MCTKIEWVGPCGMTDELSRKLVQTNGPNAPGQIHCCRFKTNLLLGFQAYKELLRKTGSREPTLPGLPYSPEQLFFISNAQVLTTASVARDVFHMHAGVVPSRNCGDRGLLIGC